MCSGGERKNHQVLPASSSSSSSVMFDDVPGASSALNVSTPSACTSECRLFQEIAEDVPDRRPLDDAEKMIARDLTELSHKERQDALHDIHGVSDALEETPEFIVECKNHLELYLLRNSNNKPSSAAFQMVWNVAQGYVRSLFLKFLRCDSYDIPKAGQRIFLHFDTKLWLFGEEKLCRDIALADFDSHDMACYKAGFFQILPVRDRAGRAICIKLWKLQKFHCRENVWRQMWYNHMIALEDEETQLKGLVQIIYNVNDQWRDNFDKELYMGVGKIRAATPIRVVSCHYCFNDPAFGIIIKLVSMALEMHTRTRIRLHYGSDVEVQYELQGFGIPLRSLPVNSEGTFRTKEHINWIKTCQAQEVSRISIGGGRSRIVIPSHVDILFGKGKTLQSHVGNLRFANLLEEQMDRYMGAKRTEKVAIAKEVISRLTEGGGRFLRQDKDGVWEPVDERTAVDKVGHGFRNRKPTTPIKKTASSTPTSKPPIDKRPVSPSDESSQASPSISMQSRTSQTIVSHPYVAHKRSKFDDHQDEGGVPCSPLSVIQSQEGRFTESVVPDVKLSDLPEKLDEVTLDLEDGVGDFSSHSLDDFGTEIW